MKSTEYNHYPNDNFVKEKPTQTHTFSFTMFDTNQILADSKKKNNDNVR